MSTAMERDPREVLKCACPRYDARECADFRNGRDLRRLLDAEALEDRFSDDDGGCFCACHEAQADFDDDKEPTNG